MYFGNPRPASPSKVNPTLPVFGIADKKRSEMLPNTPTFAEQGYPEVMDVSVSGIWAPAGTPKPVLDKLQEGDG